MRTLLLDWREAWDGGVRRTPEGEVTIPPRTGEGRVLETATGARVQVRVGPGPERLTATVTARQAEIGATVTAEGPGGAREVRVPAGAADGDEFLTDGPAIVRVDLLRERSTAQEVAEARGRRETRRTGPPVRQRTGARRGAAVGVLVALGAVVGLPASLRMAHAARRTATLGDLRVGAQAATLYAGDNDDKLPPGDLVAALASGLTTRNPNGGRIVAAEEATPGGPFVPSARLFTESRDWPEGDRAEVYGDGRAAFRRARRAKP